MLGVYLGDRLLQDRAARVLPIAADVRHRKSLP
jgi:hypothetical protein